MSHCIFNSFIMEKKKFEAKIDLVLAQGYMANYRKKTGIKP